jgi:hypothetical protein
MCNHCNIRGLWYSYTAVSENDIKLAQKLGQRQPFIAVFSQESMGQLLHLLGQPDTLLASL